MYESIPISRNILGDVNTISNYISTFFNFNWRSIDVTITNRNAWTGREPFQNGVAMYADGGEIDQCWRLLLFRNDGSVFQAEILAIKKVAEKELRNSIKGPATIYVDSQAALSNPVLLNGETLLTPRKPSFKCVIALSFVVFQVIATEWGMRRLMI